MLKLKHITLRTLFGAMVSLLVAGFASSCSDDNNGEGGGTYDPSKPVTITDFSPKTGGMGQKIILYGSNFGTDSTKVKVFVGGKRAPLINVKNDCLYFFMPNRVGMNFDSETPTPDQPSTGEGTTGEGSASTKVATRADDTETTPLHTADIKVTVGDKEATIPEKFSYIIRSTVGTLCGYKDQDDRQGEKPGTFKAVEGEQQFSGIYDNGVLTWDPLYHNRLYMIIDGGDAARPGIQMLDFNTQKVSTVLPHTMFDNRRLRGIDFAMGGKYMLVAVDNDAAGNKSTILYIVTRNDDGTFSSESECEPLAAYKQCNGVTVNPKHDNEVYFNSYEQGQIFKIDLNDYFECLESGKAWDIYPTYNSLGSNDKIQYLFDIDEKETEAKIFFNPSGKYVYIMIINHGYIKKVEYNEETHTLSKTATNFVGARDQRWWQDGVGVNARFNGPYQGVFVKNQQYVNEGRPEEDQYDFYVAEMENHDVRKISPEGIVETYAGRGNLSKVKDNNDWGNENGTLRGEARFNRPSGIAYDEAKGTFYVIDRENRLVREISEQ